MLGRAAAALKNAWQRRDELSSMLQSDEREAPLAAPPEQLKPTEEGVKCPRIDLERLETCVAETAEEGDEETPIPSRESEADGSDSIAILKEIRAEIVMRKCKLLSELQALYRLCFVAIETSKQTISGLNICDTLLLGIPVSEEERTVLTEVKRLKHETALVLTKSNGPEEFANALVQLSSFLINVQHILMPTDENPFLRIQSAGGRPSIVRATAGSGLVPLPMTKQELQANLHNLKVLLPTADSLLEKSVHNAAKCPRADKVLERANDFIWRCRGLAVNSTHKQWLKAFRPPLPDRKRPQNPGSHVFRSVLLGRERGTDDLIGCLIDHGAYTYSPAPHDNSEIMEVGSQSKLLSQSDVMLAKIVHQFSARLTDELGEKRVTSHDDLYLSIQTFLQIMKHRMTRPAGASR